MSSFTFSKLFIILKNNSTFSELRFQKECEPKKEFDDLFRLVSFSISEHVLC